MGVRAGIIECPHCGNHLQDTRQEHIDCRFCGKRFKRGTVGKEKEEAMRRDMVMDLSDKIQKRKSVIFAGKVFGLLFIVMAVILLFSEEFTLIQIIFIVVFDLVSCSPSCLELSKPLISRFRSAETNTLVPIPAKPLYRLPQDEIVWS